MGKLLSGRAETWKTGFPNDRTHVLFLTQQFAFLLSERSEKIENGISERLEKWEADFPNERKIGKLIFRTSVTNKKAIFQTS